MARALELSLLVLERLFLLLIGLGLLLCLATTLRLRASELFAILLELPRRRQLRLGELRLRGLACLACISS